MPNFVCYDQVSLIGLTPGVPPTLDYCSDGLTLYANTDSAISPGRYDQVELEKVNKTQYLITYSWFHYTLKEKKTSTLGYN